MNYGDTGAVTAVQVATGEDVEPGTPVNLGLPTITGTPEVGKKLTAHHGEWDTADLHFSYQWNRDGVAIPGATKSTYTVASADQGGVLTVTVTAAKTGIPSGTATSEGVTVLFSSTTKLAIDKRLVFSWERPVAAITVKSGAPSLTGTVTLHIDRSTVTVPLTADKHGKLSYTLPKLSRGLHVISAEYGGADGIAGSSSAKTLVLVLF